METIQRFQRLISFNTINDHVVSEIKCRLVDIINQERKLKKINMNNLDRCLRSLGYNYPIIMILKKYHVYTTPLEYYIAILLICGINFSMIFTDDNHAKRKIKNRQKLHEIFDGKNEIKIN